MQINQPVPDFSLSDQRGRLHHLSDYRGQLVAVVFWSAECPWSARADQHLLELAARWPGQLVILPIAANVNEPEALIAEALQQRGLDFVLRDPGCGVADAWGAQTTPHVFLIDASGVLRYQGAVDDVTFRKRTPDHFHVQEAVAALLAGRLPERQETPPYGCTIVRFP
jgi:peroxiredoxin